MPQVDTTVDSPGAGLSVGQYNADINIFDFSTEPADAKVSQGEAGELNLRAWDPNTGLEPMSVDENELDEDIEIEDMLPEEVVEEIQGAMVNLMVNLENFEWLPPKLCKRIVPKKTGMISFAA